MKNKRKCPNFDALARQKMEIVPFIFPGGTVGALEGRCRGFGALTGSGRHFEETIGVYTDEGDYFNITIDLRVKCAVPTFWIGSTPFYYPVVECATMGARVDPSTGNLVVKEDNHEHSQP